MWGLKPQPGFGGGGLLKEAERKKLGLDPSAFAMRVGYIVDWGQNAETGRAMHRAGLKKGDILLSVGGKKDFATELEFQTWFRFTRKPGEKLKLALLRDGKPKEIEMTVLP